MRLLFVVQRYGTDFAGGAEQHCRLLANHLAESNHQVEVLTSRAVDGYTWDNHYPPGSEDLDGVRVHRLSTAGARDQNYFDALSWRVLWSGRNVNISPVLSEAWLRAQGPFLPELVPWLSANVADYDVLVFFTYLFFPTWAGLRVAGGRVPTVLHAAAHDEPQFWLPVFDTPLRSPDVYAWYTDEERVLLRGRGLGAIPGEVIGVGTDLEVANAVDAAPFRKRFDLGDKPYLLVLGRIADTKGSTDVISWFAEHKRLRPGSLKLVLAGPTERGIDAAPDVILTGYLSDEDRRRAFAGALALVQPSYLESFSIVLSEAWAAGKPALVQSRSDVLAGQARRSKAALSFSGFAEFSAAVSTLIDDPELTRTLGEAGRRFVIEQYSWPTVLSRYEALLDRARSLYFRKAGLSQ